MLREVFLAIKLPLAYLTCDYIGVLGEYTLLVPDDFDKLHVLMCLVLSALEQHVLLH